MATIEEAAITYVAEHFAAIFSDEATVPSWFGQRTCPLLTVDGSTTAYDGKHDAYMQDVNAVLDNGHVHIQSIQNAHGAADSIIVTVNGAVVSNGGTRPFVLTATLGESDEPATYYVVSEHIVFLELGPIEQQAEATPSAPSAQEAAREEEAAVSPPAPVQTSPPATSAKAPPSPAKPVAQSQEASTPAPAPQPKPAVAAPKPSGWAAIAAASKDQPLQPAPPRVVPAAAPKKEEPVAQAPRKEPLRKEPPKKEVRTVESTAVFKIQGEVSDADIMNALPPKLVPHVIELRNKSADPAMRRVWIEFAIAGAVNGINEAGMSLMGKPITAEPPRKKNN
jgi:hypothetical protein